MLISHIPAGFILTKTYNKVQNEHISFVKYGLLFSIWPDIDLLYFYFVDKKSTFHHLYFTHLPIALLVTLMIVRLLSFMKLPVKTKRLFDFFLLNWVGHILLDSITGGIAWIYPLNEKVFTFIKIPAIYDSWIMSFIFHWSFVIELIICLLALLLAVNKRRIFRWNNSPSDNTGFPYGAAG